MFGRIVFVAFAVVLLAGCAIQAPTLEDWQTMRSAMQTEETTKNTAITDDVVAQETAVASSPFDYKGISIVIYGNWRSQEQIEALLDRLVTSNIGSVSYTIPFYSNECTSNTVYLDHQAIPTDEDPDLTPSFEHLAIWISEAHERGMSVLLRPYLEETAFITSENEWCWRGSINPQYEASWFSSYWQNVIEPMAKFAEEQDVEILSVGVELSTLEPYEVLWQILISRVRGVYSGELVYSTNWHGSKVEFWHLLDYVGIDAFFELDSKSNSVKDLTAAWQPWLKELQEQADAGIPILITEIGLQSAELAYLKPWQWDTTRPASQETQANYYEATCATLKQVPVTGIFWWAVASELPNEKPEFNPATDLDYTPLFKDAEQVMVQCYAD